MRSYFQGSQHEPVACLCGHADRHTTADENAPYPPTLEGATHPQNWGPGGYFQGSNSIGITTVNEKILVIEDNTVLQGTLQYNLEREGYTVLTAADGVTGLSLARQETPHLIILDLMLPQLDGLSISRILREDDIDVPILILTAKDADEDKIRGLEWGADDYMTKPFSMRELLARVKALLRRSYLARIQGQMAETKDATEEIHLGDLIIDTKRHQVFQNNKPLTLKPKEFNLLLFLAHHRGVALSRDRILEEVWGWNFDGGSRTVDVHIRWLREKIEPDPTKPTRIITVRGIGYRFEG